MSSAVMIATAAVAVLDLGIAYAVYRVYRWVSATGPSSQRQAADLA